jgi:acetyl-CoA C-acetyltransferase
MRLVTLVHEIKRRNVKYGLETICGGGGLGICAVVEGHPGRDRTRQRTEDFE